MVCEGRGSDLGWKKRLTRNKQKNFWVALKRERRRENTINL